MRGTIFDRKGRVVAASVPSFSIAITPQDFDPYRKQTLPMLAHILGVDTSFIVDKINQGGFYTRFQPIKIWRDADARVIAEIEENLDSLPGVDVVTESKREYIAPVRASHLLGYTKEISQWMLDAIRYTPDSDYYHPGDVIGMQGSSKFTKGTARHKGSGFHRSRCKGAAAIAVESRYDRCAKCRWGIHSAWDGY